MVGVLYISLRYNTGKVCTRRYRVMWGARQWQAIDHARMYKAILKFCSEIRGVEEIPFASCFKLI